MGAFQRFRELLGKTPDWVLVIALMLYFLSITILRSSPWLDIGTEFSFGMALAWGVLPLLIGLIRGTPSAISAGFILACLGPYNLTSVILAFLLGTGMGIATLIQHRSEMRLLLTMELWRRGFGYILAVTAYAFLVWVIRLGDSTDGWSFLAMASSLLTIPFAVYSLSYLEWDSKEARRFAALMGWIVAALMITVLAYPLLAGEFEQYTQAFYILYKTGELVFDMPFEMAWIDPDYNWGSVSSSHYLAALMLFAAAAFCYLALRGKRRMLMFSTAAIALYCYALGENAHIIPGVLLGLALVLLWQIAERFSLRPGALSATMITGVVVATFGLIAGLYSTGALYGDSQKAKLYSAASEYIQTQPGRALLGEGPASFASRAANKRVPTSIMQLEYDFIPPIPEYVSPKFERALQSSANAVGGSTMEMPVSGLAGIVIEWGFAGTLLLLGVLWLLLKQLFGAYRRVEDRYVRALAVSGIFAFVVLTVSLSVRTYFEYTELTSVAAMLIMVPIAASRKEAEKGTF